MVLIAVSLGIVLYALARLGATESAIVALTALIFMVLYNAVSARLRDRTDAGSQIADLSRGTADLARQVAEFGRRLAAAEGKIVSSHSTGQDRIQAVIGEINELGVLVTRLAATVAGHDEMLASRTPVEAAARAAPAVAPKQDGIPSADVAGNTVTPLADKSEDDAAGVGSPQRPEAQLISIVKNAIADNRIDIYLQPIVTLPQRKVRFYEAVTRLRDDRNQIFAADDFIETAEAAGLMGQIDHIVMLRCMQVLRRLMVRNKDVGVFCNIAHATLSDPAAFAQCIDFLEANRALAGSFVLEFKQATFRSLGPVESKHLAALAQRGYRFSIDHVTDLRMEPRDLADRGLRFIKVPAALLLDQRKMSASDIHPADLSDLLGRYGIDLIAERIEGERAVIDLLDYDVRFGQGFLFAAPRPLRPETGVAGGGTTAPGKAPQDSDDSKPATTKNEPQRATGNAALARRFVGPT